MNRQWIPIVGIVICLLIGVGLYGQSLPRYDYRVELQSIPTQPLLDNGDGTYSFVGAMQNVGNAPCKARLVTPHVEWNYSNFRIPVNHTVVVQFTVTNLNQTNNIIVIGVNP